MAQDKGYPPLSRTVEVQIDVVDRANNPPVWDHVVYGPIYIRENLPVGAKVVSVKARSVVLPAIAQICLSVWYLLRVASTPSGGTVALGFNLFVHASSETFIFTYTSNPCLT